MIRSHLHFKPELKSFSKKVPPVGIEPTTLTITGSQLNVFRINFEQIALQKRAWHSCISYFGFGSCRIRWIRLIHLIANGYRYCLLMATRQTFNWSLFNVPFHILDLDHFQNHWSMSDVNSVLKCKNLSYHEKLHWKTQYRKVENSLFFVLFMIGSFACFKWLLQTWLKNCCYKKR